MKAQAPEILQGPASFIQAGLANPESAIHSAWGAVFSPSTTPATPTIITNHGAIHLGGLRPPQRPGTSPHVRSGFWRPSGRYGQRCKI